MEHVLVANARHVADAINLRIQVRMIEGEHPGNKPGAAIGTVQKARYVM